MLKTKWIETNDLYDGQQLRPLYNYQVHDLVGSSVVAWVGPCDVHVDHMKDLVDLKNNEKICGKSMLHFVFEIFDLQLLGAVFLQRLFASIVFGELMKTEGLRSASAALPREKHLHREGDDLYFNDGKLSISVAIPSVRSSLIHFALNVVNEGTPVKTCALSDFGIDPREFANNVFARIENEFTTSVEATYQVRS